MLKIRVASGAVAIAILIGVVWAGQVVLGFAVFLFSILALNEFYKSVSNAGFKPVRIIGYLSCLPVLLMGFEKQGKNIGAYLEFLLSVRVLSFGTFLIMLVLFSLIIFFHNRYNLIDISLTFFGILYITFLFSFIVLTRNLNDGFFFVWLIFIGAPATDTFAYFSGLLFGKRKLMPAISPKKTVEGSIGGVIGCTLVMALYGLYLINSNYIAYVDLYHYVVMGLLCGIISQVGDWAASAIKRFVKVKDYGNIMPGHGGVLDRFDSILFTAPVIYFYLSFFIIK